MEFFHGFGNEKMGTSLTHELKVPQYEPSLSHDKVRWGGMIPCCVGEENGVGYILLAEQPVYPLSAPSVGGWNPLWGSADDSDVDLQHTAAREASEEARNAVGSISFIRELLLDSKACCTLFNGCFLAGYGILDKSERDWIVDYHRKNCLREPFNKYSWEVKQLKWFEVSILRDEIQGVIAENREINSKLFGNRIRPSTERTFKQLAWSSGPLYQLANGEYPFKEAEDSWKLWREGKWVSKLGEKKMLEKNSA